MKRIWIAAAALGMTVSAAHAQYGPPPGPPPGFWDGAPQDPRDRIDYLDHRIDRDYNAGRLDRGEVRHAKDELRDLRGKIKFLHQVDGRLSPQDAGYIQNRLDQISHEVKWHANHG